MSNKILFIFEGEDTEKQIVASLQKYFFSENTVIKCVFGAEIYQIYKELEADEDLDVFNLIKGRSSENNSILKEYSRNDFAEIYMFFDYDGHATLADDEKIKILLAFFNEETDKGKLYISYPMVEALKHISTYETFRDLKVKCKQNIKYKSIVHDSAIKELRNFNKYSSEIWIKLLEVHLQKMNYIVSDTFVLPKGIFLQNTIFSKQSEKYINLDATVAVLSGFPIFLHDYYGNTTILKHIETQK